MGIGATRLPSSSKEEVVKRGTIYWVNLQDHSPPEFGKLRPGLVLSNTAQNVELPTIVILPISSKPPEIWPLRIEIRMPDGRKSYVVTPGIRQVSKERLEGVIGALPDSTMDEITNALEVYLND